MTLYVAQSTGETLAPTAIYLQIKPIITTDPSAMLNDAAALLTIEILLPGFLQTQGNI